MRIGVIGSGEVGTTLAAGFAKHGHAVTIATRTPPKLAEWSTQHPEIRVGTLSAAAAFGELIVLAVKAAAAAQALQLAGTATLAGKVIIDTTNPVTDAPPVNGVLGFYTSVNESALELVADMGAVEAARAIEPLCLLWCIPGFLRNEWSHAFKLLRS
jgi:predicted dinucleotide-binding enzyme